MWGKNVSSIKQSLCNNIDIIPELRKQGQGFGYSFTQLGNIRLPFHFCIYYNTQDTKLMYLFNVCLIKTESG